MAALVVAALTAAAGARAEPTRSSALSWTRLPGSESCVAPPTLARAVEQRLGRAVFVSAATADLTVEGRVERAGRGFRAVITATRSDGTVVGRRELRSEHGACSSLDNSVVLVIALMIDPSGGSDTAPAPPPPAAPPQVIIRRERVEVPVAVVASAPPWGLEFTATGGAIAGLLPAIAPGVVAEFSVTPPEFVTVRVGAEYWASRQRDIDGHGARVSAAEGLFAVCPLHNGQDRAVRWSACGGAEVGVLVWSADDVAGAHGESTLIDLDARGELGVRLVGPLYAVAGAGIGVPLRRPSFSYTSLDPLALRYQSTEIYRVAPLVGAARIGAAVYFP